MKQLQMKTQIILTTVAVLFTTQILQAQDLESKADKTRFKTSGGLVGYGQSVNTDTRYEPFYFSGDFSWSFTKVPKHRDFVAWYFEPQVNIVRTQRPVDIEFGANLGIRNYIKANDGLYFYQMLGSGPHYISAEVKRQANGFIFSDNLAVGAFTRLNNKGLFLNLQFRIRHLSNAELKQPNGGINMWSVFVGLSHIDGR
jgi:hypothetical protein